MKKTRLELRSLEKSGGEGSFGLAHCLDQAARTGGGGLTGGEGAGTGGRAMVRAGVGLVMSWVICCSWAVRATRVVLIVYSECQSSQLLSWNKANCSFISI